jgi:hypothetical protein
MDPNAQPDNPKGFTSRLTSLFSLPGTGADSTVPKPGTPPTFNPDGSIADDGNPFIGPIDPKYGYATEGYSGSQLRTIRRAQQRREAAQQRVGQRAYNRQQKAQARGEALVRQRQRVLDGEVEVTDALYQNIVNEAERIVAAPTDEQEALRRQQKLNQREDDLADRRESRFRAGKPRGKDLREETYNEYESFLPGSFRNQAKS